MNFFIVYIFPTLVVLILALFFFIPALRTIKKRQVMLTWPKTQAKIESSEIEERTTHSRRNGIRYTRTILMPLIRYSYEVMGFPFESDQYTNWAGSAFPNFNRAKLEEIISQYPPGETVMVTYNPDEPAEAYITVDTSLARSKRNRTMALLLMILAILWSLWGGVLQLKESAADRPIESGLIPLPGEQIISAMDSFSAAYGMTCHIEGYGGIKLVYDDHYCQETGSNGINTVEVFSRREAPEKVDLISALHRFPDSNENMITYFSDIAVLAFNAEDLSTVQDWIKTVIPTLSEVGNSSEFEVNQTQLRFDVLGKTIQLTVGKMQ